MKKLTKRQLQNEIVFQENNIEVYESLIGEASEAKKSLALLLTQLIEINLAEQNESLDKEQKNIQ